jgi:hypothetical protein
MTTATLESRKTDDSRLVESLAQQHFPTAECYRYNSGSLRLRIIDERFRSRSEAERQALVEPILKQLPESAQEDLFFVLLLAPGEEASPKNVLLNQEFTDPTPSRI